MRFIPKFFERKAKVRIPTPIPVTRDPWFWSHYEQIPNIVRSLTPARCFSATNQIVDFGCGDGAATLGMAERAEACVTGLDLYRTFAHLPNVMQQNLGRSQAPANLRFIQNELGRPLPVGDNFADLIYSWSVFEHLADVSGALSEFYRISKPNGVLFIQIDPLYYSPFGSHLQRLVGEPWAHLRYDEQDYLKMITVAKDTVPPHERDTLYNENSFEDLKKHLLREYRSLNKITAEELTESISAAGFRISMRKVFQVEDLVPDMSLVEKFGRDNLMTNQIVVVAEKPEG
jgi:ubiquinone/menaquinone biosynthesis C-methylase UbiE